MTQGYNESSTQIFYGLSSDTKPTGCDNGSIFIEMDTKIGYIYDAANADWTEIPNGGGSQAEMDYNEATNKPAINDVTLSGNKTPASLGLQTKINSDSMLDADLVDDTNSDNKFVSATDIVNWNGKADADDVYNKTYMDAALAGKQAVIDDLSDIRSGAALGATSLQPSDVKSTYSSSGTDPVNGKAVAAAIGTLDVAAVGGSGSFISGISETNGKISATAGTFDSAPTQSSTNPVTSAGIYTDQARQDTLEAQDRAALIEVVDNGAKNYINLTLDSIKAATTTGGTWSGNVFTTTSGMTFTVNSDGTITASSSDDITSTTFLNLVTSQDFMSGETLVLSGCPEGGSASNGYSIILYASDSSTRLAVDQGAGASFVANYNGTKLAIRFQTGKTYAEKTFKPMICTSADWNISHKYVPYKQDITWGLGDKIPQNSDFNSYTTPGVYRVENSIDAATMLHIPVTTDGGRLEVSIGDISTEILHTYFSGNVEYRRSYNGSTWSYWVQILSTATLDEIPTANSTNAVMSGGVQDPLAELVDNGAKNLLRFDETSTDNNNVRFTVNADGSITATEIAARTTTAVFRMRYTDNLLSQDVRGKILSGCPSGGSDSTYKINIEQRTSPYKNYGRDTGNGLLIPDTIADDIPLYLYIQVYTTATLPLTFKPMICTKAQWDIYHQYEPYALPNPVITPALIELVDSGAKNQFDPASAWDSKTAHGVTITRNGDTYSIASGTTQSGDNLFINMGYQANTNLVPAGDWVLSFDTPQQNVCFQACWNGQLRVNSSFGNNCFFTVPKNTTNSWFRILLRGSTDMSGTSFKIMLCPRVLWDVSHTFVPYRPSWQEMTDNNKIIDISSQITAESGYTVESTTHLYYQNKQVFGTIAVAINSGSYSSSLTAIAKLPVEYAPARQYLGSCGFSTDQWAITDIGYAFIQAANASSTAQRGQISVKSPTANLTHMILNVCYPVQIDATQ